MFKPDFLLAGGAAMRKPMWINWHVFTWIIPGHAYHHDVIKWKHFPRYWPFVRGIHRSGEFPAQRPVTRSFDVFFDLRPNKRLSKQPWGWWLIRHRGHCDVIVMILNLLATRDVVGEHGDIFPRCWMPIRVVVAFLRAFVTSAIAVRVLPGVDGAITTQLLISGEKSCKAAKENCCTGTYVQQSGTVIIGSDMSWYCIHQQYKNGKNNWYNWVTFKLYDYFRCLQVFYSK